MNATPPLQTKSSSLLDAALAYAAHGWAVFPVMPEAKKPPLTPHGCKDASKDPAQITAWWGLSPDANLAVATGAISGITVLDMDVKDDKHGDQTLAALVAEHGELPPTVWQTTWSGGRQYFFKYDPRVGNTVEKIGPGLDTRGDGGYVVVPPSTVTEDGRAGEYTWDELMNPVTPAYTAMPEWLIARIVQPVPGSEKRTPQEWETAKQGAPAGRRQDELPRMVGRFLNECRTESTARLALHAWVDACEQTPGDELTHDAADECFDRIVAMREAKGETKPTVIEASTATATRASFTEMGDDALWPGATDDIVEPIIYHWQDFVAAGSVVTILGAKKASKSWLQALLAVSAAAPEPLAPGLPSGNQRVLIVSGPRENSDYETKRRIKAIRRQYRVARRAGEIRVRAYHTAAFRLEGRDPSPQFDGLLAYARDFQPNTIMLDSTAALWGGKNENDTAEVQTWLEKRIEPIKQVVPGATVYLAAHTGHPTRVGKSVINLKHQRGASRWGDATDTLLIVSKVDPPIGSVDGTAAAIIHQEFTRLGEETSRRLRLMVTGGPRSGKPVEVTLTEIEAEEGAQATHPTTLAVLQDALGLVQGAGSIFRPTLMARLKEQGHGRTTAQEAVKTLLGEHPWPFGAHRGEAVAVVTVTLAQVNPETKRKADLLVFSPPADWGQV